MKDEVLFMEKYGNKEEKIFIRLKDGLIGEKQPKVTKAHSFRQCFLSILTEVFLPQGFPDSVHPDYVSYQIWDTVQAFASTIMGTLTTHSIMQGVGVGKSSATPLAAAVTWILKDGTGMVGRIIFAWWNGGLWLFRATKRTEWFNLQHLAIYGSLRSWRAIQGYFEIFKVGLPSEDL